MEAAVSALLNKERQDGFFALGKEMLSEKAKGAPGNTFINILASLVCRALA